MTVLVESSKAFIPTRSSILCVIHSCHFFALYKIKMKSRNQVPLFLKLTLHKQTASILAITICATCLCFSSQIEAQQQQQQSRRSRGRVWSSTTSMIRRHHQSGDLIFSEEFYSLDRNLWEHEIAAPGRTNGEFQSYDDDPTNSYVRNGILYIKPTINTKKYEDSVSQDGTEDLGSRTKAKKRSVGDNSIVSARINTRRAFGFRYGHLEVRAKLPKGDWIWPAIWLMPQGNKFGMWPNSGEIDIMESRGNRILFSPAREDIGCNQFGSTLHFGINRTTDMWRLAHFKRNDIQGFHTKFHNYGLIWTPEQMIFTLDDEVLGTVAPPEGGFWEMGNFTGPKLWDDEKMSPFNQPFYIMLNVAVGGTSGYFPENTTPPKPWKNKNPSAREEFWKARPLWLPTWDDENSALQVDYIRIWAL